MNTIKYIGIDIHQATSVFAIRDSRGNIIGESILKTEPTTIVDFLKGQRGTVRVTFEEGTYASWILRGFAGHQTLIRGSQINDLHSMIARGIFAGETLGHNRELARQIVAV
jgi:hypothetical protein